MKMQRFLRTFFSDLIGKMMVEMVVRNGYRWENEGVWERSVCCVCEKMKKKKWRGPLSWLAKIVRVWDDFLVVGSIWGGWVMWGLKNLTAPPPLFSLNKGLRCYKISLRHSRTLGTRLYHRLPHGMILPNYINISLGHSRTLDTWPHHRLPHGMILTF